MEEKNSFSWSSFESMAHVLEALGYLVLVFGPLVGIGVMIFASGLIRVLGIVIIFGSVLVGLYHISFSYMMHAMKKLIKSEKDPKTEEA